MVALSPEKGKRARQALVLIALTVLLSLVLVACTAPPTPSAPTATPEPPPTGTPAQSRPVAQRWIEVVLGEQKVLLHEGDLIVGEYPASCGVGASSQSTTYPGEYRVQTMYRGPEETAPGVFVRDIVIFDWEHGNGFHSLPMDKDGKVLDSTLGKPASAGCIRLAASDALYRFAAPGMRVVIHN